MATLRPDCPTKEVLNHVIFAWEWRTTASGVLNLPNQLALDVLLTGQPCHPCKRSLGKVCLQSCQLPQGMTSPRFDRVHESSQTSLAALDARLSLLTITGGTFNDTRILSIRSTPAGGSHVTKMYKQVDFILHKRADKRDLVNSSSSVGTERAPMIGCELAEGRHLARDAWQMCFAGIANWQVSATLQTAR
jgi:hypothetical protein